MNRVKVLNIPYNPQTDNRPGNYGPGMRYEVRGSGQCGYNSALHFLYPWVKDASDGFLQWYLQQIESQEPGTIGAEVRQKMSWFWKGNPGRRAGAALNAHAIACETLIQQQDANVNVILVGENGSENEIMRAVDSGSPVVMFTLLAPPSYHFICVIGYEITDAGVVFIVHDSYGNFYPSWNPASLGQGNAVRYPAAFLRTVSGAKSGCGYYFYANRVPG